MATRSRPMHFTFATDGVTIMSDCFFVIGSAKVDRTRKRFGSTQCGNASRLDALTFKIQNAYAPVSPVLKTAERDERHGTRNTSKDKRIDLEASRHFTIACHELHSAQMSEQCKSE